MAIAFDAVSSHDGGIATTNTYAHTVGAGASLVTLAIFIQSPTPTGSATYNGTSMNSGIENTLAAFQRDVIYTLASPSTGANNVITTASASARNYGGSISLTGCDTSALVGNSATATGTSTTPSASLTTARANSWVLSLLYINSDLASTSPTVTGSGQTQRFTLDHVAGGVSCAGSTQTTTSTGSYTASWTLSASNQWTVTSLEIQAPVSASVNSGFFIMM